MDLSLTESQEMLKSTARDLVEREFPKELLIEMDAGGRTFAPDAWERMREAGWTGMLTPREYGGEGASFSDAAVVAQELGRGPVPGPFFGSAVLGVLTVLEAGTEGQRRAILSPVASGEVVLGMAVTEPEYGWDAGYVKCLAQQVGGGYRLEGTKLFAQDLEGASQIVCAARLENDAVRLFVVDATSPGVSVRGRGGFSTGAFEVRLEGVEVAGDSLLGDGAGDGWAALERAMEKASAVLCAYQVGASEQVFETTLDYSNTRVQFGVAIGRFQRVQDHIIDMVNHLDAARWTTNEALWKLDTGRPYSASVHMAKAVTSEAYYQVCNGAHEVHAGIGVMREYGLTLHTKMSRTLYDYLGNPGLHKRRLGDALPL